MRSWLSRAVTIIAAITAPIAPPVAARAQAPVRVQGVVFDSLRKVPLAGATVTLGGGGASAGEAVATDSLGRFALDDLTPGTYTLRLSHPELDAIGLTFVNAEVVVAAGMAELKLYIPSFETFWRYACGRYPPADSMFLAGFVRRTTDDRPVAGATVELSWVAFDWRTPSVASVVETRRTTADASGAYGFCGVPSGAGVRVIAMTPAMTSGAVDLPIGPSSVRWHDLLLGELSASGEVPIGTVTGTVRRLAGPPLAGATVQVDANTAVTDSAGRYTIGGVHAGTRRVDVLALGSRPAHDAVEVRPGRMVTVPPIQLEAVSVLNTVRIEETIFTRMARGIMARRQQGVGRFIDSTKFAGAYLMTSPFANVPGTRLVHTRGLSAILMGKETAVRECAMNVFIDGVRQYDQEELWALRPDEVAVVEVYARGLLVPTEFVVPGSTCGAIAVWTKRFNR